MSGSVPPIGVIGHHHNTRPRRSITALTPHGHPPAQGQSTVPASSSLSTGSQYTTRSATGSLHAISPVKMEARTDSSSMSDAEGDEGGEDELVDVEADEEVKLERRRERNRVKQRNLRSELLVFFFFVVSHPPITHLTIAPSTVCFRQ